MCVCLQIGGLEQKPKRDDDIKNKHIDNTIKEQTKRRPSHIPKMKIV